MRWISIDVETYSGADLSSCGVHRYVEDPDFQILLIGYSIDGGPVKVHDCTQPGCWPRDLLSALTDPDVEKRAWNAAFERTCFAQELEEEMPPEQWSDTMIMALECGLPGSLAGAGVALGLPEEKLKDPIGKSLIRYFSIPCRPTKANGGRTRNLPQHDPDKWALYIEYNRQDVVTEMAIREKLSRYPLAESEQELWALDQRMNDRGVRLDVPMIREIVRHDEQNREKLQEEAREITGLKNPNSLAQLKAWLDEGGIPVEQLRKDDVDALLLREDLPEAARRMLEIRKALGKTSVAKYGAMLQAVCKDNRLRGILQFYGANRSGRWAGRIVQTHNLARNTLPDLDLARHLAAKGDFDTMETLFGETSFVLSELIRTAFIPSWKCRFVVSDFSAIEARVLAWLAGEQWVLDAFRAGKDIYCETASMMYHVPVVKHGENGELRQKGKIATLACGYQGGVGAMKAMDREGAIPEEELQAVVDQWRTANPRIVKLWRDYEAAAMTAIRERRTVRRGIRLQASGLELAAREAAAGGPVRPYSVREGVEVAFSYRDGNLFIKLPSGRKLCYWGAQVRMNPAKGREEIVYMGVNQTTKQWGITETYGGKIVENVTQATARDCLAEAMRRVTAMGYRIVMHVHDEMIVDVPREDRDALERINGAMSDPIPWAPGLPLKGDGYECDFYKKD
jgi:DNA polymerase